MLTINDTLDGFLHDLEIKGNSIIDSTTSEVKSVGDKLGEQDLYKITLLSTNDLDSSDSNYKKYELEILSPVQLEKVGDKCDRIICNSDNLWVVEKNVRAVIEDGVLVNKQAQPETILLSLSQRIALRTFADRTNISFLTEIEGTIKAQVPKSLGATVNTHTTQIDNLNKELDRVKKLEESTVSIVTSDKAFTTVSETTQGYFEDVKIEGKTLVNCFRFTRSSVEGGTEYRANFEPIFGNKTYTIINNYGLLFMVDVRNHSGGFIRNINIKSNVFVFTLNEGEKCSFIKGRSAEGWNSENTDKLAKTIILEGDHTDKDITFFEGLKSVGQDTDEIEILSNNGNFVDTENTTQSFPYTSNGVTFSKNNHTYNVQGSTSSYPYARAIEVGKLEPNTTYSFTCKSEGTGLVSLRLISRKYSDALIITPVGNTFTTPSDVRDDWGIDITSSPSENINKTFSEIMIKKVENTMSYKPYALNKKEILYYNPTTETWEKPVLREWDSIEKHSDGKYYYHKRSEEVVLSGSEDWKRLSMTESIDTEIFYVNIPSLSSKSNNIDLVTNSIIPKIVYRIDEEGIYGDASRFFIRVLKSKLSTQDTAGFKAWLQANPITVVYQLAQEEIYECTNLDLITYPNETNLIVNSGAIQPKLELKVHSNVSNVVKLLQEKVSILESDINKYMISQNRSQLDATYKSDSVTFKIDYVNSSKNMTNDYSEDLYNLILDNILVGKDNYNYNHMFNLIMDYASWNKITWEQFDELVLLMDLQHNPIEELPEELN